MGCKTVRKVWADECFEKVTHVSSRAEGAGEALDDAFCRAARKPPKPDTAPLGSSSDGSCGEGLRCRGRKVVPARSLARWFGGGEPRGVVDRCDVVGRELLDLVREDEEGRVLDFDASVRLKKVVGRRSGRMGRRGGRVAEVRAQEGEKDKQQGLSDCKASGNSGRERNSMHRESRVRGVGDDVSEG